MAKLEDITNAGVACFDCVSAALLTSVCMDREQRLNSRDSTHFKADAMHRPSIETRFYCTQVFLSLDSHCWLDVSGLRPAVCEVQTSSYTFN